MTRRPVSPLLARCSLLLLALTAPLFSATAQTRYGDDPEGYWLGAFVRDGSVQVVDAAFTWEADTLRSAMTIPDWAYYPAYRQDVARDEHGRFLLQTVYGPAATTLDTTYQEMIGRVGEHEPALRLHLKRNLRPPQVRIRKDDVTFPSGDVTLAGTLVQPDERKAHPAIVMIHGRGCSSRQWAMGRAEVLARYGIASLVYDKRGVGQSTGDCANATLNDLTDDVLAAIRMLADRPDIDAQQIGVLGASAGGWVAPRAATRSPIPVAFVITLVGAGTSVQEQQSDNARYITTQRGLS